MGISFATCSRRPLQSFIILAAVGIFTLIGLSSYLQHHSLRKVAHHHVPGSDDEVNSHDDSAFYAERKRPVSTNDHVPSLGNVDANTSTAFLVDTPHCKIPDVDPFDKSIKSMIGKAPNIDCAARAPGDLTFQEGNVLNVNVDVLQRKYGNDLKHCCYKQVIRAPTSDQVVNYLQKVKCFKDKETIPYQFIRVICYNNQNKGIYKNLHAFVLKDEERKVVEDGRTFNGFKPKEKLNVLVIGVDSVSRLNFIRQMPKTRNFLLEKLSAVELKGYNKVADNTFVNIVPMFTGKYLEELPWDESKSMQPFDPHPMVWKNFSSHGYRTLFAEDFPKIAIFNYLKFGFKSPPTDNYFRPFGLAMAAEYRLWNSNQDCFGARLETDVVLDYTHDFAQTFSKNPHFGFTFITRLTHEGINRAGSADKPHSDFLKKMDAEGLLDNTVLFYMSDHGARFGPIVSTYVGKLEERLPLMYVAFPRWFHEKYPKISHNLKLNSARLTTPFDIYKTFIDILKFDGVAKKGSLSNRGISILDEIPEERTCESASILPHWCACQNAEPTNPKSKEVLAAGQAVVDQINTETKSYRDICFKFGLQAVTDAMKMQADDKLLTFKQSLHDVIGRKVYYGHRARGAIVNYLLTIKVMPGGGLFEATVRYEEIGQRYTVLGDMSRIDKYGNQSHCIDVHRLKKFCYCTSQ